MTYLTEEDWKKNYVHKICDDKSFSDYLREKLIIQNNLLTLIQKLFKSKNNSPNKLIQRILYSSLIYFHKYILCNGILFSDLSFLEKITIYSACIFLSFKTINKLIHIDLISSEFKPFFNKGNKIKYEIEDINKLITNKEFDILLSIQFQINIDWPNDNYIILKHYLSQIGQGENTIKTIVNYVHKKINESILFPFYLYYTPIEILISSLILIKEEFNLNFININNFIEKYKLEIDKDNIGECSRLINKIIKQKKVILEEISGNENINNNKVNEKINFNVISSIRASN